MSVKQLCNNYQENLNLMQRALRVSASFDIVSRKIQICRNIFLTFPILQAFQPVH